MIEHSFHRRGVLAGLGGLAVAMSRPSALLADTNHNLIERAFHDHKARGCFVVNGPHPQDRLVYNKERATQPFFPASTFKIINSLIALETGVVPDVDHIMPYGGKPQPFAAWERDMSMRDAIQVSNVPVYQEIAGRIGTAHFQDWLSKIAYGNEQVGPDPKMFWLNGPLRISALGQVHILQQLATARLPFLVPHQRSVRDIIRLGQKGQATLFGKTGWTAATSPDLGWFVGWVENPKGIATFALNMDITTAQDAPKRKTIALQILSDLGIYG